MRRAMLQLVKWTVVFVLIASVLLPTKLAAAGVVNDNHTDSEDYCLRAYDVTLTLSDMQAMASQGRLADTIRTAAQMQLLIRDNSTTGDQWKTATQYTEDFSAVQTAPSAEGYVVTVILPPIRLTEATRLTYRVFVVDDTTPVSPVIDTSTPIVPETLAPTNTPDPVSKAPAATKPRKTKTPTAEPTATPTAEPTATPTAAPTPEATPLYFTVLADDTAGGSGAAGITAESKPAPMAAGDLPAPIENARADDAQKRDATSMDTVVQLLMLLGASASGFLAVSVLSDLRVLRWYNGKKRAFARAQQ